MTEDPGRLAEALADGVKSCGGWMVGWRSPRPETLLMQFEFVRGACLEIYCLLVGAGVELTADSHRGLTGLCNCTGYLAEEASFEVASVVLFMKQSSAGHVLGWGEPWTARAG